MTHEPKSPTEGFIEETGAKYGYAFETSMSLMRALGAGGFPSAYLVDPTGTIVWEGHPAALDEEVITSHLDGALRIPLWEWPRSLRSAMKYVLKGEFEKAFAKLEKADEEEVDGIREDLRRHVELRLRTMESALERGDVLRALTLAEELEDGLSDMPEAARARAVLEKVENDPELQRVLELQEDLADLVDFEGLSQGKLEKRSAELREFIDEAAGTYAGTRAHEALQRLLEMLR